MQQLPWGLDRHCIARSAVVRIPDDWMPKMRHRRSDLVQITRLESNLDERRVGEDLDRCHPLPTRTAALGNLDVCRMVTLDREG